MSDVLVWIPGVFPDTRPLWPTQVSTVINLHRSKLPRIPNEEKKEVCVCMGGGGGVTGERKKEENRGQRRQQKRQKKYRWQEIQELQAGEKRLG